MIQDLFCDIYSSIENRNPILRQIRFYSVLRWLTRRTANIVLPIAFRCCPAKATVAAKRSPKLIVSLTTFPARIRKIWLVLECMMRQTVLPDKIILWLSKEQFDSVASLPASLLRMQARGVEIRLVDGDIRSHKKYVYALQQYPDDILVTVDDDIFYRSTMIADLLRQHKACPEAVVTRYAHNMRYDADGALLPYTQWENNATDGTHLFFCSGGGTLFPPHCLHTDVLRTDLAMQLCPCADDVWLNAMARLQQTPVVHLSGKETVLPVLGRNDITLFSTNEIGGNDRQIHQLTAYCRTHYNTNPFEQ